ncbi:MAG: hypothetical protein R3C18_06790 [Planctomycetaceae bacterium]
MTQVAAGNRRRRWLYLLAVVTLCCVLGIVIWNWPRRPPAFDITGAWSVQQDSASNSTPVTLTFASDGDMQVNGMSVGEWRMEGNELRFGAYLKPFGTRGPTIPYYPSMMEYSATQDSESREITLSQTGSEPTIVLTRVDAVDADDPDTPTE